MPQKRSWRAKISVMTSQSVSNTCIRCSRIAANIVAVNIPQVVVKCLAPFALAQIKEHDIEGL